MSTSCNIQYSSPSETRKTINFFLPTFRINLCFKKKIVINPNMDAITTERVITLLAEYILERDANNLSDEDRANYEHNVQDALAVLEKLKTGLDVNLKFDR